MRDTDDHIIDLAIDADEQLMREALRDFKALEQKGRSLEQQGQWVRPEDLRLLHTIIVKLEQRLLNE